jgi:cobalt-zinc-cadmium efflux system outer membrane protein
MKRSIAKLSGFVGMLLLSVAAKAQVTDSIHITLQQAENQFVQKNLQLLAEKYNIDISKAEVIQAKLYPNPNFSFTANAYDPTAKKPLNISNKNGEYEIALQQLIRLAGKRNKEIKLAETSMQLSEAKFYDLMRTLQYALRSTFYNAYYLQQSFSAYTTQIASLQKMSDAYYSLQQKDVVTLKDAVRIRSMLYSLQAEQAALVNQLNDAEADMQALLQNNNSFYIIDITDTETLSEKLQNSNLQSIIDTAYANRPDLKIANTNMLLNTQNYALQKALAVPDITIGAQFDKRGSFVDNASFISIAIDLPFFNRNQGNIRSAKISMEQSKVQTDLQAKNIVNEVQRAYIKVINTDKALQAIDPAFKQQFETLLKGVTDNFQKKNVSLLEFTDFYEAYKDNVLHINNLQNDRMQAIEQLNFAAGRSIFTN